MTPGCADCDAASLRAKGQGFRGWRTDFACWEHAAYEPPAGWADGPASDDEEQADLFEEAA